MKIKKLLPFILFLLMPIGVLGFEESAIIYNSTTAAEQQIALGIRKEGQMGASSGRIAENAYNIGIAFKFDGSSSQGSVSGWRDATTPGCLCEGWGAGFIDRVGRQSHFREVNTGETSTVIRELDQLLGNFDANLVLSLHGAAADVRCQDAVIKGPQR